MWSDGNCNGGHKLHQPYLVEIWLPWRQNYPFFSDLLGKASDSPFLLLKKGAYPLADRLECRFTTSWASSLSSSYNGDKPVECTFNEGPASTTAPTCDKEHCLQKNAADSNDITEQPQPPMVEYVHTSGEEANEPMKKDLKAEHHCSKHPTITKIQYGRETTEVQQKDSPL